MTAASYLVYSYYVEHLASPLLLGEPFFAFTKHMRNFAKGSRKNEVGVLVKLKQSMPLDVVVESRDTPLLGP